MMPAILCIFSFIDKQAQVMLSEIYPGVTPKMGSTYWNQIHEMGIISVSKRVLKRFHEFLDQVIESAIYS